MYLHEFPFSSKITHLQTGNLLHHVFVVIIIKTQNQKFEFALFKSFTFELGEVAHWYYILGSG